MKDILVIGSRGSKLALTQVQIVKEQIQLLFPSLRISIEVIKTSGDVNTDPLSKIGGKDLFTKELEDALLDRRVDVAVHSLKDLPTIVPEGLAIAAICKREDPRDALVLPLGGAAAKSAATISTLPKQAVVGNIEPSATGPVETLATRPRGQRSRGNVDTRLRKLDEGQYDALLLACAGLRRLQLETRISAALTTLEMLPAVGQGALAIEVRHDDELTTAVVSKLDHKFTRLACVAERALLRRLGGGCQLPIAAHAVVREKRIRLDGLVADVDGRQIVRDRISGSLDEAEELGYRLAQQLLAQGARELLGTEPHLTSE